MKGIGGTSLRGLSLIEVLVALLVLGIGVMGYAALQLKAVRMTEDTYARSQAMAIAQDMMERIRANVDALSNYTGANWTSAGASAPAITCTVTHNVDTATPCTPAQIADNDVYQSVRMASSMLPTGKIAVTPCDKLTCVVVAWNLTTASLWNSGTGTGCNQAEISNGQRGTNADCVIVEFIP